MFALCFHLVHRFRGDTLSRPTVGPFGIKRIDILSHIKQDGSNLR